MNIDSKNNENTFENDQPMNINQNNSKENDSLSLSLLLNNNQKNLMNQIKVRHSTDHSENEITQGIY